MQKIYIGLGVLVVGAAVLIGVYGIKPGNRPAQVNSVNNEQNQGKVNEPAIQIVNPSGLYSINELFNMKRPMKCTWKEGAAGNKDVTNIIYINGKSFYQDVTMGDIGHAYAVNDGEYLYIWNDFTGVASKMKITDAKTGGAPANPANNDAMDQKRDFVCENWTVDASVFNPPQDKNFKDVTEEMTQSVQDLKENSETYKQQACDMCAKAPSQELIDECLQNMQCN